MAKDLQGTAKDVLGKASRGASKSLVGNRRGSAGPLSGAAGMAAGAGAAAVAPLAVKGVRKLVNNATLEGIVSAPAANLADKISSGISEKIDTAGGPAGILKDSVKGALGLGGDQKKGGAGAPGTGKGRRMPVQQSVDIGAPVETVYNQWTQFEAWPDFMHRVVRVTQEEDSKVAIATKIWGQTREFTAEIETQRPDEVIKWRATAGMAHSGVVSFHELAPRLTRVLLSFDVEPGGLLEKAARGMRHIKRAARGDLHRFKAFIEMEEEASGGWRGTIEKGQVVPEKRSSGRSRGGSRGTNGGRPRSRSSSSSASRSRRRSS